MQLWQYSLLVTVRLLYMFRTTLQYGTTWSRETHHRLLSSADIWLFIADVHVLVTRPPERL